MAWSVTLGNNDAILLRGKVASWMGGVFCRRSPDNPDQRIFEVRGEQMGGARIAPVRVRVDMLDDGEAFLEFGKMTEGDAPKLPVRISFPHGVLVRKLCAKNPALE